VINKLKLGGRRYYCDYQVCVSRIDEHEYIVDDGVDRRVGLSEAEVRASIQRFRDYGTIMPSPASVEV
jgi:hypothetical protein